MRVSNLTLLRAFPGNGGDTYRIEWFGNITHTGRFGGHTPMAQIVISHWQADDKKHTTGNHTDRFSIATIPIAFLRLFRIGDIWSGGRQIGSDQNFVHESFEGLEINANTVTVVPAGLPLHSEGLAPIYLLPFSAFEAHRGHTGAFCARVRVDSDVTLVVPCMELIRFYFGASGGLLKQLFSGAQASSRLYTSAKINPSTGIARLELAPNLPGVAASTIGRIAFDAQANKAARWIVSSGVSASANGERHYPKTTFPFTGITDLSAQGRWINLHEHRVFLVERLIRCTHPFPFRTLFYISHMDLMAARQAARRAVDKRIHAKPSTGTRSTIGLTEARVASNLQTEAVTIEEENACPFPDLLAKPVRRIKKDRPGFARRSASSQKNELAVGDVSSTSNIRAAEITTEPIEQEVEESLPYGVQLVQEICEELGSTGLDYVRLAPVMKNLADNETPFMQASSLASASDSRLENIWAARLITRVPDMDSSLLLLIKEKEPWQGDDGEEQVILFSYNPDADQQGIGLEKRLHEFANMGRETAPIDGKNGRELHIGLPYGVFLMPSFLTRIWGVANDHYGGQKT